MSASQVLPLQQISAQDVSLVGGKNASLGELIGSLEPVGVRIPSGFATTAAAYRLFLSENALEPTISARLEDCHAGRTCLPEAAAAIRKAVLAGKWPAEIRAQIGQAYRELCRASGIPDLHVAVRSSATAEDLPGASFAGQQETYLNISGEQALLAACKRCYASLYTDRAIAYREAKGFAHEAVALSVGVQRMVRSDLAGSGVMF